MGFSPYHVGDSTAILSGLGFPLLKRMQRGGSHQPKHHMVPVLSPSTSLHLAGASETLVFYLPFAPSSLTTAWLQSSTFNTFFWSTGEGFSWKRHRKVKITALPQQLGGQKVSCAMTETLGACPGIYMVICIRLLTRRSFQHRSLGDSISFLTIPTLTPVREFGLHKGIVR